MFLLTFFIVLLLLQYPALIAPGPIRIVIQIELTELFKQSGSFYKIYWLMAVVL